MTKRERLENKMRSMDAKFEVARQADDKAREIVLACEEAEWDAIRKKLEASRLLLSAMMEQTKTTDSYNAASIACDKVSAELRSLEG